MIYLDNSATSFYKPTEVKNCVINALNTLTANPGRGGYSASIKTGEEVFNTRELLKQFFNAANYEVIFTKNCTEALNLAILGSLKAGDHVITSVYEHNSVLRPLKYLQQHGVEVDFLDCPLEEFHKFALLKIKPNTKMIVCTAVSNVTGDYCNLNELCKIKEKHNLLVLIDGAQASGHIEIDLEKCNIDMYAFAGHKGLLSLTGVGGLIVKKGLTLQPILFGGTGTNSQNLVQPTDIPEGLEAGTIPTISIISLGAGTRFLIKNFKKIQKTEQNLSKKHK